MLVVEILAIYLSCGKNGGLDKYLQEAYENGTVLAGISAGSICWFEQGVTDSVPGKLSSLECLGFIKGSNCPHYDGETERRDAYHRLILEGMKDGVACDDGVAAYYVDGQLVEYVSSRESASAFNVERKDSSIQEDRIAPRFLG